MEKKLTKAISLCAFAVATVLIRHSWSLENRFRKFSAAELCAETDSEGFFHVDAAAFNQGICIFKTSIEGLFGIVYEDKKPTEKGVS